MRVLTVIPHHIHHHIHHHNNLNGAVGIGILVAVALVAYLILFRGKDKRVT